MLSVSTAVLFLTPFDTLTFKIADLNKQNGSLVLNQVTVSQYEMSFFSESLSARLDRN